MDTDMRCESEVSIPTLIKRLTSIIEAENRFAFCSWWGLTHGHKDGEFQVFYSFRVVDFKSRFGLKGSVKLRFQLDCVEVLQPLPVVGRAGGKHGS
jgi:hypothetical protein